ncbi:MAG TPA: hypothetical protein DCO75_05560 [Fibrobacteres bacterium]|nr:hypothetical protein [Fibrobacterota bacterium]
MQIFLFFSFFSRKERETPETSSSFCNRAIKSVTRVSFSALPEIAIRIFEDEEATGSLPSFSRNRPSGRFLPIVSKKPLQRVCFENFACKLNISLARESLRPAKSLISRFSIMSARYFASRECNLVSVILDNMTGVNVKRADMSMIAAEPIIIAERKTRDE